MFDPNKGITLDSINIKESQKTASETLKEKPKIKQQQTLGQLLGGPIGYLLATPKTRDFLGKITGAEPIAKGISTLATIPYAQKLTQEAESQKSETERLLRQQLHEAILKGDTVKAQHLSDYLRKQGISTTTNPLEEVMKGAPTKKEVIGGAVTMGTWLLAPSMPMPGGWTHKAILIRAALSAPIGVSAGLGDALMRNKDTPEVIKEMVTSGITASVLSFGIDEAINGIRWAVNKLPVISGYVSEVPQETLEYTAGHPEGVKMVRKELKGLTPQQQAEKITGITQQTVKGMRKDLTNEWQVKFDQVIQENIGVRTSLNDYEERLLNKVNNIMPLENMPSNTAKMSLKETHDLYSQVEDILGKNKLYETAEGVPVRELANKLRSKMITAFGGEESNFARLLSDYSTKKHILDSAGDLAKAWGTTPQNYASAVNNLKKIFNDDKFAYLDAIRKLEQETGKNLLDYIAAWNTSAILPYRHGGFGLDELFRLILSPITSPRAASALVSGTAGLRNLGEGTITQFGRTATPILQAQILGELNKRTQ